MSSFFPMSLKNNIHKQEYNEGGPTSSIEISHICLKIDQNGVCQHFPGKMCQI